MTHFEETKFSQTVKRTCRSNWNVTTRFTTMEANRARMMERVISRRARGTMHVT